MEIPINVDAHDDTTPPPQKDEQDKLKWRGDPSETFSDWTIEIVGNLEESCCLDASLEDKQTTLESSLDHVYHVHKFILGYGARRSDYFTKVFQNGNFREAQSQTSRIMLPPLAAQAFPALLDYVYNTEKPLNVTTETATALYSLGEYFGMRNLRWEARQFAVRDLSLETMVTYYVHARMLQNDAMMNLLVSYLAENIKEIEPTAPIVQSSDPELWQTVWKSLPDEIHHSVSIHLSQIVAELGKSQPLSTWFYNLTAHDKMPQVHPGIALDLCRMEDQVFDQQQEKQTSANQEEEEEEKEQSLLSSLQARSIVALTEKYTLEQLTLDLRSKELLKSRKPDFLVELLCKAGEKAARKEELLLKQVDRTNSELEELEAFVAELVTEQRKLKRELSKMERILQKFEPVTQGYSLQYTRVGIPDEITPFIRCDNNTNNPGVGVCVGLHHVSKQLPVFFYHGD